MSEGRIVDDWPDAGESFRFTEPHDGTEHLEQWLPIEELRGVGTMFHVPAWTPWSRETGAGVTG